MAISSTSGERRLSLLRLRASFTTGHEWQQSRGRRIGRAIRLRPSRSGRRLPLDAFYLSVSISPSRRNSAGTGRTRSIGPGSTRVDLAGGVRHLREPKWRPRLAIWKDLMGGDGIRFDPAWASWEYHTVRRMAQAIDHTRDFDQMPILGDALEDAGCHTRGHP
jgi:hypothetical protein